MTNFFSRVQLRRQFSKL